MTTPLTTLLSTLGARGGPVATTMTESASTTVHGTGLGDILRLFETSGEVTVKARGGKDQVELYGLADYRAKLGNGDDTLLIDTIGTVTAIGGTGDDTVTVEKMNAHHVDGGDGNDWLSFEGLGEYVIADMIAGEAHAGGKTMTMTDVEHLRGSAFGDVLRGGGGASRIEGMDGDDQIFGEGGKDRLDGGDGDDVIDGGASHDTIRGGFGDDLLNGGEGADHIEGGDGADVVYAGNGADYVHGGDGSDTVYAGDATDANNDEFRGGDGYDRLDYHFAAGGVVIDAGAGTVTGAGAGLKSSGNTDTIAGFEDYHGTRFDDVVVAGDDRDDGEWFYGGEGDDIFFANAGFEVFGGAWDLNKHDGDASNMGFDTVDYSRVDAELIVDLTTSDGYLVHGENDSDLHFYQNIDKFIGTVNDDEFTGDDEGNVFDGHDGNDVMTGGGGADTFAFREAAGPAIDTITDFESGIDLVELSGMEAQGGVRIEDFGDLDTNGDGVLDARDAYFSVDIDSGDGTLTLGDQFIKFTDVTEMAADDFAFV